MAASWTITQLESLQKQGKIRGFVVHTKKAEKYSHISPKKIPGKESSIYGNEFITIDGIKFRSKREAKRYQQLVIMRKAGLIGMLELQVPYELNEGGTHSMKYIADFVYIDAFTGERIVEDCKGMRTKLYKKKCNLMKKLFGIIIKET